MPHSRWFFIWAVLSNSSDLSAEATEFFSTYGKVIICKGPSHCCFCLHLWWKKNTKREKHHAVKIGKWVKSQHSAGPPLWSRLSTELHWEWITVYYWIAIKLGWDIHVSLDMNFNNWGSPDFLGPSSGLNFNLFNSWFLIKQLHY